MRNILFICCTILLAKHTISQQTLIPYRVGNKWGLSDVKGTIVVPPVYDEVDPANYSTMFITRKNGRYGAVYDGKEVLKAVYKGMYAQDDRFFKESYSIDGQPLVGSSREIVYNIDGKRVMNDTLHELKLIPLQLKKGEAIYITSGVKTSGVFIYDDRSKKIIEWVLSKQQGYLDVGVEEEKKQVNIYRYSRASGNKKFILTYNAAVNKYSLQASKEVVKDPELTLEDGLDGNYLAPSSNHMVKSVEFKASDTSVKRIISYQRYRERSRIADTVVIPGSYGDLTISTYKQPDGYELYQFSNKPNNASDLQDGDTVLECRNYLTIRQNRKLGFMAEDTLIPPQFERLWFFNASNRYKPYFLVSKLVNSNQLKYGVIRSDGFTVLPIEYDSIIVNRYGGYAKLWIVKKDGKYGIALHDGSIIKQPQYDSIAPNTLFHSLAIIHKGRYGYYDIDGNFCEPILPLRPTFVTQFNKQRFLRIAVGDNELVCYANFDGTVYYKEK